MRFPPALLFVLRMMLGLFARGLSTLIEGRGDAAYQAGDRAAALFYHGLALVVLLTALVCFIWAFLAFRRRRGAAETSSVAADEAVDLPQAEPAFDADAVMARYLAQRQAARAEPEAPAAAPRPGFGRKRI